MSKLVYSYPVIHKHSTDSDYKLFHESKYYFVWVRGNNCDDNWKIRVEAKSGCVHAWFSYIKSGGKWILKKHPTGYAEEQNVSINYYTIQVDGSQLPSVLSDIIYGIYSEHDGNTYLEIKEAE